MKTSGDTERHPASAAPEPSEMFVVGIGASAGGLDAISELLARLPPQIAFPIVIVQHLDAAHESLLVPLLSRVTKLPVDWAADRCVLAPGHVYVAPPKTWVGISAGVLQLERSTGTGHPDEIDSFFRALAADAKDRAVGVILSGSGADGAQGVKAIKDAGGFVFAQDERTAGFGSMPRAAIDSGCADRVLRPRAIADELIKLVENTPALWRRIAPSSTEDEASPGGGPLTAIFRLLASRTGVDFSEYKQTTIRRRLARQMALSKAADLPGYLKMLQRNREEVNRLYEALLINVTDFFRDPEYFVFLREVVFPPIIQQHRDGSAIRLWVPGCSTGEEPCSLAILLREMLEELGSRVPVQVFGTDVSEAAVAAARAGRYSAASVANVPPALLQRFFTSTERGYMMSKSIRDMCIFARQNVVRESPFSHLDLLSCRNLMIYLGAKLQRKLLPIFHYALNPGGYLMLGNSESIGARAELFQLVDRRFRVYARKPTGRRPRIELPVDPLSSRAGPRDAAATMSHEMNEPLDVIREADRIVVNRVGPAGVLISEHLEILQFRGNVSPFLAPSEGRASLNLIRMAREGLGQGLQEAVQQARDKNVRVRKHAVSVMEGTEIKSIDIDVTPIATAQGRDRCFLVLFTPTAAPAVPAEPKEPADPPDAAAYLAQIEQLRQDLKATRSYLQSTIERHEATDQELRAANEEIQSSNEELQSTNEELETAKEELQSTNEELTTINEELHSRQLELIQLNNDLTNLINSVHLPIVILAQDLRIRRFTPMAEKTLNLIASDVGRPLTDLNINLKVPDLPRLIAGVMDSLTIQEFDVQDNHGRWYSMRLRPYKTSENKIDGVVLTLVDVDEMKRTMAELEAARDFARATVDLAHEPFATLDSELRITLANSAFYQLFHTSAAAVQNRPLFDALQNPRGLAELKTALEAILPNATRLTDYEVRIDLPGTGPTQVRINARQIVSPSQTYPLILMSIRKLDPAP